MYREEVDHLVDWCRLNNLVLNVDKTKEMIIDFRRTQPEQAPLSIRGVVDNVLTHCMSTWYSSCRKPVVERTQTFSQAEEKDNITIRLDIQTQTDMSLISLVCFFRSNLLKVLFRLINGVEVSESQHQQFAGRVQWDRDALGEGQIRLHESRPTAEDSGRYWCDQVGHDKTTKPTVLETSDRDWDRFYFDLLTDKEVELFTT
ncbi:uncharacterized protein LOC121193025 [Toxotes jaculatrix]|uniref:uncharacterized protein LOC121193025 n=1 Tax=Toxotes jaculatrix TaxID=941984 RepID=UPI001B3AE6A6|nr:uncharacterized protein LOC121193025 [Toxotes jaculatrix]